MTRARWGVPVSRQFHCWSSIQQQVSQALTDDQQHAAGHRHEPRRIGRTQRFIQIQVPERQGEVPIRLALAGPAARRASKAGGAFLR